MQRSSVGAKPRMNTWMFIKVYKWDNNFFKTPYPFSIDLKTVAFHRTLQRCRRQGNQKLMYPLISIVLCSYNGAKFIDEQIQSLLQQTYPNLEIIISDDASTDNTPALLEKYKTHPAFK